MEEGDTIGLHRCQVGRHCDVALDTAQQLDAQHSLKLLHLRDDEVFHQALDLGKGSVGNDAELDDGDLLGVESSDSWRFNTLGEG